MTATMRELDLDSLILYAGGHDAAEQQMCVMEAVAFVAGEPWSDHPKCASRVIGDFLRSWNDAMNDDDRQKLVPLVPKLVGTAAGPDVELRRSWMALDWYCRVSAPAWLRLAGLKAEAEAIEATAPIVDPESAKAAQDALSRGREAAYAAWAAARAAAGAAAWAAAGAAARAAAGAAARAAARDAAWAAAGAAAWAAARDAAWAAAGAAAWAAAWAAARDAAWAAAQANLRPTVEQLQASAIELVERMIAVGQEVA